MALRPVTTRTVLHLREQCLLRLAWWPAQVWVTARASDDVLCFAAARLVTDPSHALVAAVRVGEAPVGLANGTVLVSNFSSGQVEAVDTAAVP